jgi:hypothetical protein
MRYVMDRFGGPGVLPDLLHGCSREGDTFTRLLAALGVGGDFNGLVMDWAVANLVNDPSIADGRYGYASPGGRVVLRQAASPTAPLAASVPQQAASYVEVAPGAHSVSVTAETAVPLLPALDAAHPRLWWSNREDSMDSRLTREVDLRGVGTATLTFQAWYDLEQDFDFAYVEASADGGRTWTVLPGRATHADVALGNSIGEGWTGMSGGGLAPAWISEQVDLSRFAGQQILLRFECLTDQGYSARGFAVADVAVPEIGWTDEAGSGQGWDSAGWLVVNAPIPQPWGIRLVRWTPDGITVESMPVHPDGQASAALTGNEDRIVLVVVPQAPRTLEPASYRVQVGD